MSAIGMYASGCPLAVFRYGTRVHESGDISGIGSFSSFSHRWPDGWMEWIPVVVVARQDRIEIAVDRDAVCSPTHTPTQNSPGKTQLHHHHHLGREFVCVEVG
jgi:hypothetical protein